MTFKACVKSGITIHTTLNTTYWKILYHTHKWLQPLCRLVYEFKKERANSFIFIQHDPIETAF